VLLSENVLISIMGVFKTLPVTWLLLSMVMFHLLRVSLFAILINVSSIPNPEIITYFRNFSYYFFDANRVMT
jgi:hypothetical protein